MGFNSGFKELSEGAIQNYCGQGDESCLCPTVCRCRLVAAVSLNSPFTGEGWRIEVED